MQRTLKNKYQAEKEITIVNNRFNGQSIDLPASKLPVGVSEKNINLIDRGSFTEGRPGSKLYTETNSPVHVTQIIYGRIQHKEKNLIISAINDDSGIKIYVSDIALSYYEEVFLMKGVSFSGRVKIIEYNSDAVLVCDDGVYLLVLSDDFKYVRKMNIAVPSTLITGVVETLTEIYGHRYLISFMQRPHDAPGTWDRLTEGYPPTFESGTTGIDSTGKDYGEVFFTNPCTPAATGNIIGEIVVPCSTDSDMYTVTDIGIYRTKNIGENTDPPGTGLGGIDNNPAFAVWAKDIPVAKAFKGSQSSTTVTLTQGEISADDIGCTLTWDDDDTAVITDVASSTSFTVDTGYTKSDQLASIGGGRMFSMFQSGNRIRITSTADYFDSDDAGKPIFLAGGSVIWVKEYLTTIQATAAFDAEINEIAATMSPVSGNFSRKYNDTVYDDGRNYNTIGLQQRIESQQQIYWPKRYFTPIPSGDIGKIDAGFLFVATRGETDWWYSQIGDKKYCLGYYRQDHQKENADTYISEILNVGGNLTIFFTDLTKAINPKSSIDIGNNDVGEAVFKIPQSTEVAKIGISLWKSIAFKDKIIYAITNEPAVRSFNGVSWSAENYASERVQKYIEAIDVDSNIEAVYIPGRFGGYHIWFSKWKDS